MALKGAARGGGCRRHDEQEQGGCGGLEVVESKELVGRSFCHALDKPAIENSTETVSCLRG